MATTFKTFLNNDITSTKTLLHEAIPVTGSLVSGTYGTFPNGGNIKNYAHGMFQSVYDYPYLSSSANHIFDLTVGYSTGTSGGGGTSVSASTNTQNVKKVNLYNQMSQVLQGHNAEGRILRLDQDGDITAGGTKLDNVFFINFARLLGKDEIKKGSFTIKFGTGPWLNPFAAAADRLTIQDTLGATEYRVNSPAGEYGILSATAGGNTTDMNNPVCGLIFYQAGVVALSGSVFMSGSNLNAASKLAGILTCSVSMSLANTSSDSQTFESVLTASSISGACNEIRHRLYDLSFNNTTELNSTIHFCRVNHNDFNYSANPTYLSSSKLVVKNNTLDAPVSYITTIGLYSADNELLAVAKLSEPLKKDPTNEMTLRVRLDY
jgi:hypothetical protein